MAQYPVELILTRQVASQMAMPVFLVDADGTLVFYNEPAERILGRFLQSLSLTIAAGSSQVQRNIISERILGMPREPR